jgi:hypothetical protein
MSHRSWWPPRSCCDRQRVQHLLGDPDLAWVRAGVDAVFAAGEELGCSLVGLVQVTAGQIATLTAEMVNAVRHPPPGARLRPSGSWVDGARKAGADKGAILDWLQDRHGDHADAELIRLRDALRRKDATVGEVASVWGIDLLTGLL